MCFKLALPLNLAQLPPRFPLNPSSPTHYDRHRHRQSSRQSVGSVRSLASGRMKKKKGIQGHGRMGWRSGVERASYLGFYWTEAQVPNNSSAQGVCFHRAGAALLSRHLLYF